MHYSENVEKQQLTTVCKNHTNIAFNNKTHHSAKSSRNYGKLSVTNSFSNHCIVYSLYASIFAVKKNSISTKLFVTECDCAM